MAYLSNPDPSLPEALVSLKILQVCQGFGLFIVPGFLLSMYFSEKPIDYLGFRKISFGLGFTTLVIVLFAFPAINLLASLNELVKMPDWMVSMEEKAQVLTKAFMKVNSVWGFLFNVFMIAVLPAVGEELIFRGILQRLFTNMTGKAVWGIIISAALFSAMHLQFQGFIPRFALGVLFGYMLIWSGSLWLPIIAHFINNLVAVIGYSLIYKGNLPPETENIGGLSEMWFLGLISGVVVLALMLKIRRETTTD